MGYLIVVLMVGVMLWQVLRVLEQDKKFKKSIQQQPHKIKKLQIPTHTRTIEVAGIIYHDWDIVMRKRQTGEYKLVREQDNKFSSNATAIYLNDYKIGYVPASVVKKVAKQLDRGDKITVEFESYRNRNGYKNVELNLINNTIKEQFGII